MLITITVQSNAGKVKIVSVFTTVFKTTEQSKNNTKQKYIRPHMEREHKERSLPQWFTSKEYCHIT